MAIRRLCAVHCFLFQIISVLMQLNLFGKIKRLNKFTGASFESHWDLFSRECAKRG